MNQSGNGNTFEDARSSSTGTLSSTELRWLDRNKSTRIVVLVKLLPHLPQANELSNFLLVVNAFISD